MRNESIFDKLAKGLGDAVTDIREKWEEAWVGRVVNDRDGTQAQPAWPQPQEVQPEAGKHEHEMDMDR
jgi:hypothetical protein